jgi:hypothetical protein
MAVSVSAQLAKGKKKKFEKELIRIFNSSSREYISQFLSDTFPNVPAPTASEFIRMLSAAKYGGANAMAKTPAGIKQVFDVVNHTWPQFRENYSKLIEEDEIDFALGFAHILDTPIGYQLIFANFFPKLGRHIDQLHISDFRAAKEISPYLFLERETNSYGFCLIPLASHTPEQIEEFVKDVFLLNRGGPPWKKQGFPNYTPDGVFYTGPLKQVFPFLLYVGTVEELIDCIPDREIISVSEHFRNYQSGKVSKVRGYSKRKPIRSGESKNGITDHIVYLAYDIDEILRYVGEGKPDRFKHVNSGASHNVKINEHFFKRGEMRVDVIEQGLTKAEALAFERAILNNLRGADLWNKKDFEPFLDMREKGYSDDEVAAYFTQKN